MESKRDFRTRLEKEGRWDAYKKRREELKAQGNSDKEAIRIARDEFQQQPDNVDNATSGLDMPDGVSGGMALCRGMFEGKASAGNRQIAEWVFDNIDIGDVGPMDAPSSGAWSFLQRCRAYPDLLKEFYRSIWARMLPSKSEIEARDKFEDDGRKQLHLLEQIERARDESNEQ